MLLMHEAYIGFDVDDESLKPVSESLNGVSEEHGRFPSGAFESKYL